MARPTITIKHTRFGTMYETRISVQDIHSSRMEEYIMGCISEAHDHETRREMNQYTGGSKVRIIPLVVYVTREYASVEEMFSKPSSSRTRLLSEKSAYRYGTDPYEQEVSNKPNIKLLLIS